MISISCMLVIATIQSKISQILPKTSYFKLIGKKHHLLKGPSHQINLLENGMVDWA
jgi:hypothetical protein